MKKSVSTIIAMILAAVICAACFVACSAPFTAEDAAKKIEGFKTSPTTISGTWVQDFTLDVDSDNQSFKAFAQDLKATVEFQLDLTAGDVYYYGKRTTDAGDTFEEIVAKSEGKYYYKSSSLNPIELATEEAAVAKIGSAFKALTTEKAGWLDVDAFLYDGTWVTDYIMLGSANVATKEGANFAYTYDKAENDGLKIDIDAKYVGYTGDSGIVDVGTNATYTGSKLAIVTNDKGHILSLSQTMNNYIEFNITNPPIPLLYTGTRTLTASYGAVTKKALTDVNMTATSGLVSITKDANTMKVELFDFALPQTITAATNTVAAGNYIALKVTCGAGYEVDAVTVNGTATQLMNGYYCLMTPVVAGGNYEANVTTKATAEGPVNTKATVTVNAADGITYELYDFKYDGMVFTPTDSEVEQGHFIALKITSAGDVTVKVDGNDAQFINGYYCYMKSVAAGQSYAVTIEAVADAAPPASDKATVTVEAADGITYELYDFDLTSFSFTPATTEITAGHYIAVKITSGDAVVKVNGNATAPQGAYLCYMTAVTAGESYTVTITEAAAPTTATVVVNAANGITYEVYDYSTAPVLSSDNTVEAGHYIAIKVTSDGNVTVKVDGNATTNIAGYYCYMTAVTAGQTYTVTITEAE